MRLPRIPRSHRRATWPLLVLAIGFAAQAGPHDHDHDRARAALERGEVLPLAEILASVTAQVPGDVVEVELEREHGTWVYELKVIAPNGRVLEVLVDAAAGRLLAHEEDD
ncbi:MAG: PepSY domain-containing protein [Thiohalocapsa sp.]